MEKKLERQLHTLLTNDQVGSPKPEIEDRLMYSFMLKNSNSKLHQNSFSGFACWLFSFKGIGMKTAILACLSVFMLMNTNLHQNNHYSSCCDSTFVQKSLLPDSALFSPEVNTEKRDTVF